MSTTVIGGFSSSGGLQLAGTSCSTTVDRDSRDFLPDSLFPILPRVSTVSSKIATRYLDSIAGIGEFSGDTNLSRGLLGCSDFPSDTSDRELVGALHIPSSVILLDTLPCYSFVAGTEHMGLGVSALDVFYTPVFSEVLHSLSGRGYSNAVDVRFLFSSTLSTVETLVFSILPLLLQPVVGLDVSRPRLYYWYRGSVCLGGFQQVQFWESNGIVFAFQGVFSHPWVTGHASILGTRVQGAWFVVFFFVKGVRGHGHDAIFSFYLPRNGTTFVVCGRQFFKILIRVCGFKVYSGERDVVVHGTGLTTRGGQETGGDPRNRRNFLFFLYGPKVAPRVTRVETICTRLTRQRGITVKG